MAPELSFPDSPFSVLLGQHGLLTFPLANSKEQHLAWHMDEELIHVRKSLILTKPGLSGQES